MSFDYQRAPLGDDAQRLRQGDSRASRNDDGIQNECQAARIHPIHLKWHYRSRHVSLITFSNNRYYSAGLYTFPSAHHKHADLAFIFSLLRTDVTTGKGNSHQNRIEAKQVVRSVVKCLSDPRFSEKSLGIVTFNEAQKNLIEDLLETKRREHP